MLSRVDDLGFLVQWPLSRFASKPAFFRSVDLDNDAVLDDDVDAAKHQPFKGFSDRVKFVEIVIHNATGCFACCGINWELKEPLTIGMRIACQICYWLILLAETRSCGWLREYTMS